jgi:hypothetical protein
MKMQSAISDYTVQNRSRLPTHVMLYINCYVIIRYSTIEKIKILKIVVKLQQAQWNRQLHHNFLHLLAP